MPNFLSLNWYKIYIIFLGHFDHYSIKLTQNNKQKLNLPCYFWLKKKKKNCLEIVCISSLSVHEYAWLWRPVLFVEWRGQSSLCIFNSSYEYQSHMIALWLFPGLSVRPQSSITSQNTAPASQRRQPDPTPLPFFTGFNSLLVVQQSN